MEILMVEAFAKIKPTDPLILDTHAARRKRKWQDSSGMSLDKDDASGQGDQRTVGDNE
jgi:hypothetical protein